MLHLHGIPLQAWQVYSQPAPWCSLCKLVHHNNCAHMSILHHCGVDSPQLCWWTPYWLCKSVLMCRVMQCIIWSFYRYGMAWLQAYKPPSRLWCIANLASSPTRKSKQSWLGKSVGRSNCGCPWNICIQYHYSLVGFTDQHLLDVVSASLCTIAIAHICRFWLVKAWIVH